MRVSRSEINNSEQIETLNVQLYKKIQIVIKTTMSK